MSWLKVGSLICFMAVALGAFGAHALRGTLDANHSRSIWETAVVYQFLHGLALVVLSLHSASRVVCYLFLAGILFFSGSLYVLAVSQASWLGPITPLGGLCFLAGWTVLFFTSR